MGCPLLRLLNSAILILNFPIELARFARRPDFSEGGVFRRRRLRQRHAVFVQGWEIAGAKWQSTQFNHLREKHGNRRRWGDANFTANHVRLFRQLAVNPKSDLLSHVSNVP